MTSHEKRMEQYEDALFAVLMEQAMETEGARLRAENEALARNGTGCISPETDTRMIAAIDRAFAGRRKGLRKAVRVLLIAALVSALLMSAGYAAVPAVKEKVDALIAQTTGTIMAFGPRGEDARIGNGSAELCGYIYELPLECNVTYVYESRKGRGVVQYTAADGTPRDYFLSVQNAEGLNIGINDADLEQVHLGGYDGWLLTYRDTDYLRVLLTDEERGKVIELGAHGVEREELERMAAEIRFIGKQALPMNDRMLAYKVPSLTDGFTLEEKTDTDTMAYRRYTHGEEILELSVIRSDGFSAVETDELLVEQVMVNSLDGMVYRKDGKLCIFLYNSDDGTGILAAGENVDGYELWQLLLQIET